jgi:hypothetical protein
MAAVNDLQLRAIDVLSRSLSTPLGTSTCPSRRWNGLTVAEIDVTAG